MSTHPTTAVEESIMTATYTFDVFSTLDGYGSYGPTATGAATGGKQGPELLDHRLSLYDHEQRMVFGANTFRQFVEMLGSSTETSGVDDWNARMREMPATVVSSTLEGPLDWPNATLVSGDAVDVVARLKEESEVPLRSHGSLSLNWALLAAGLVDRVQRSSTGPPCMPESIQLVTRLADHRRWIGEGRTVPDPVPEGTYAGELGAVES
jgi:RibD C-terminal domain